MNNISPKQLQIQSLQQEPDNKYLDAKSIPKFEFQIMNDELVNCIKELYYQSKNQEKTLNTHKKELQEKLYEKQLIEALQCIEGNFTLSNQLSTLLTGNGHIQSKTSQSNSKPYNDPGNPVMTNSIHLGQKLSQITEILSIFNNKITQLDKKVTQTEEKLNLNVKEKITSVEEQLIQFIKDYRVGFNDINKRVEENKLFCETKAKEVEMNTLWKINEAVKRLEERPTVDMIKNSINEMEQKLIKLLQTNNGGNKVTGYTDTVKIEQDIIKLKKLIDFNTIETQSQVKSLNDKIEHNYMTLKSFADEKLDINKKIENLTINNADHARKIKSLETKLSEAVDSQSKLSSTVDNHNELLNTLTKKVENLINSDEITKILANIDPHVICRMGSEIKSLETKMTTAEQRISSLSIFTDSLRSKMEFWNAPHGQNPEKVEDKLNIELITKIIKEEINNSELKIKMNKHDQQILDLSGLKEGLNDIIKKLGRLNKDTDMTNLKYEIQGVQEYAKKEILILSNRIFTLENTIQGIGDTKRRPLSARTKDDGKMFASLSTKKLIPANCISCHQTTPISVEKEKERRTVFNSKLMFK